MEVLPAVIGTMETTSTEKAASLLTAITHVEFLMAFVVTECGYGFIKVLTVPLVIHKTSVMHTVKLTMLQECFM